MNILTKRDSDMGRKISLKYKLLFSFLAVGLIPALFLEVNSFYLSKTASNGLNNQTITEAVEVADKIDRNLFERYGDVQAFGYNTVIEDQSQWYKVGAKENKIASVMNNYVVAYGLYYITMLVDQRGNVIAVNDVDNKGNQLNTSYLYDINFSSSSWFKDAINGNFYTAEGALTGTVLEDTYIDENIAKIYGDEGITIGFSAPVKDSSGNIVGVWKNFARYDLVEQIIKDSYESLERQGYKTYGFKLINNQGQVILNYNPSSTGRKEIVRNLNELFNHNLLDTGFEPAKLALAGKTGLLETKNLEEGTYEVTGYTKFRGALGFIGMPWALLVHADSDEIHAAMNTASKTAYLVFGVSIVGIFLTAFWAIRSISKPVERIIEELNASSQDLRASSTQVSSAATSLATGASQNSASLEESAAALEEISSMSRQTSDNAQTALDLSEKVKDASLKGVSAMKGMSSTINSMRSAAEETETILHTIDEIAFQTNLLALNAAVEAARAGDAGKGFAVVAEEVRNLAQRSANAAKETAEKIRQSKEQAMNTVRATNEVSQVLEEINQSALKSAALVKEISVAIKEQTTGIVQVNSSVTDLDSVTQQNAAAAEESSAAAGELQTQAVHLDDVVGSLSSLVHGG